jgi:phosphatidylglycerophosphate synthase
MDQLHKNSGFFQRTSEALESITRDRTRTNLLKKGEQKAIAYLVQCVPSWVSSNMLTAFGFFGNLIVFTSFLLAKYIDINFLFISLPGFAVSWLGDSLDGRLAYYRNKPRKYFGFTLDITVDWISILLIGYGFIVYVDGIWELFGYAFVLMYGWEMIIALMRYKITGKYSIDAGKIGPTEVRIIIASVIILEVIVPGSLNYSALVICFVMLLVNITDTGKLLRAADEKDAENGNESKSS